MASFNNKSKGLAFMEFYEPRFIQLLNQYYFSRYEITIKKNEDKYGVDCTFIHPVKGIRYGVELKTVKSIFHPSVANIAVYENNQQCTGPNKFYDYIKHMPVIFAYLDWQRRRFIIVHDQNKVKGLFKFSEDIGIVNDRVQVWKEVWCQRLIPIDQNIGWFDEVIQLDMDEPLCCSIERWIRLNV